MSALLSDKRDSYKKIWVIIDKKIELSNFNHADIYRDTYVEIML